MKITDLTREALVPFDVIPEIEAAITARNLDICYTLAPNVAMLPAVERVAILTKIRAAFKRDFREKDWNAVIKEADSASAPANDYIPCWKDLLICHIAKDGTRGAPHAILANAITALREAPEWSGVLAHNEFMLSTMALKPPPWDGSAASAEWTDHEDRLSTNWLQHQGINVSVEVASHAVQAVAQDHRHHPVREYLGRLTWAEGRTG